MNSTDAAILHTPDTVSKRCYARVGLLGNPSDGYGGCTLSVSVANYSATVTVTPSASISFQYHPTHDGGAYTSLASLADRVASCGVGTGVDLLKALCMMFWRHCQTHHIPLRHSVNFTMSYETDIPRQSGLAGSSAIVTAGLHCLMEWYGLTDEHIPLHIQPNMVLAAETALNITAGLQDRVIQVYGGLVFMDFTLVNELGYGQYDRLDTDLLPPLYLISGDFPSSSGKAHSTVKQRWLSGDLEVQDAMKTFAHLAREGRVALERRDVHELARLMNANFDLRRKIFGDEVIGAANLNMVQVARSVGAAAKLPGSGGTVLVLCPDGVEQESALQQACVKAGFMVTRVIVGEACNKI